MSASSSVRTVSAGPSRPARHCAERLGLLVDLLEHEVREAALLGGLRRPVHPRHGALAGRPVDGRDRHPCRPEIDDVSLGQEDHPVRVGQDRRHVRGEERLAVADAHDRAARSAGRPQPVGLAAVHDGDRVGALDPGERGADGIREIAGVGLLHQVRQRLRVGIGVEHVAARLEPVPQLAEVLDDPVVDDGDAPVQSTCGWALRSFGRPWVAQRVWARPIPALGVRVEERRPRG